MKTGAGDLRFSHDFYSHEFCNLQDSDPPTQLCRSPTFHSNKLCFNVHYTVCRTLRSAVGYHSNSWASCKVFTLKALCFIYVQYVHTLSHNFTMIRRRYIQEIFTSVSSEGKGDEADERTAVLLLQLRQAEWRRAPLEWASEWVEFYVPLNT